MTSRTGSREVDVDAAHRDVVRSMEGEEGRAQEETADGRRDRPVGSASEDDDVDSSGSDDGDPFGLWGTGLRERQLRMLLGMGQGADGEDAMVPREVLMRRLFAMAMQDDRRHRPDTESPPTDWNDQLVSFLTDSGRLHSEKAIAAFNAVDRGSFVPPEHKEQAYHDRPFRETIRTPKAGQAILHLSQPSMYADTVENLMIRPGDSVLNVGSGSGYLSLIFAFMVSSP